MSLHTSSTLRSRSYDVMIDMPTNHKDSNNWAQKNRLLEAASFEMDDDIQSMYGDSNDSNSAMPHQPLSAAMETRPLEEMEMDDDICSISDLRCFFEDDENAKTNNHPTSPVKKGIQYLSYSSSLQRLPRSGASKRQFLSVDPQRFLFDTTIDHRI
ncbi:unnamed protein product [Cylindrotheca closterium]|uniref:Uncharacterized protein n=1 Tax=Cylindrotheca closterium TaxID=2856 RepID=A0AAD2G6M9_9STRA|nr:unnamed protein product [Cylindrotheca closterium]